MIEFNWRPVNDERDPTARFESLTRIGRSQPHHWRIVEVPGGAVLALRVSDAGWVPVGVHATLVSAKFRSARGLYFLGHRWIPFPNEPVVTGG